MWEFRYKNDYLNCVYDLMADAAVQSMRLLPGRPGRRTGRPAA